MTQRPLAASAGKVGFVYKRYQIIVADAAAKAKFDQYSEYYAPRFATSSGIDQTGWKVAQC